METRNEKVLEALYQEGEINICSKYGESGYELSEGKKEILLANWNHFDKYPNFMKWIEDNYEIEWDDEWTIDYEHGDSKAYRISGNSYQWEQQIMYSECGEFVTPEDHVSEWIELVVLEKDFQDNPKTLPSFLNDEDIIEEGFELLGREFQNGWHPGQNDDPKKIAEELFERGFVQVLFKLSYVSQFDIGFKVFVK